MLKFLDLQELPRVHWFLRILSLISLMVLMALFILFGVARIFPPEFIDGGTLRGVVLRDQVWSGQIIIDGDLVTVPGANITIKEGTKVLIARNGDKFNIDFLPSHLKNGVNTGEENSGIRKGEPFWDEREKVQVYFGSLNVEGTKERPVIFSSDSSPGSPYDINLIRVFRGKIGYTQFSNYRRFEAGPGVVIKNSSFVNTGECALCIDRGEPLIENNIFKGSKRTYISIGTASPKIYGNKFWESEGEGLIFHGDNFSQVRVVDNFFHMPQKIIIRVVPVDQGGVIARNLLSVGDVELPCNSKVRMRHNFIKTQVIFNNPTICSGEYIFEENFWDIKEIKSIMESRIVGANEKFVVKIPSILLKVPQDVSID